MASRVPPSRTVVLVVEDEPLLRLHAVDVIEDAGFTAVEARNADQAIAILESRDDIRIVFTDISMPGSMDGLRLAAAVRDRWPPVEIIVTSGNPAPGDDELPSRGAFFPKPYTDERLVRELRRLASV